MKEYKITAKEYDDGTIEHYDENNHRIYFKNSAGLESWKEYDENNNMIHSKNSDGREHFYINNKVVSKEEWEKHYNKTNKLVINGK